MACKNGGQWEPWGSRRATTAPRGSLWSRAWGARSCLQEGSLFFPPCSSGPAHQQAPSPSPSQSPGMGTAPLVPTHCPRQHPRTAALWEPGLCSVEGTSPQAPHAASRRANPAHVSRDSHTFVGALPEQPANAKGSAGSIHTQGQGAAPHCCTSLAAFHSTIPPSPTHISFVPPFLIPTFLCCPPRHPLHYPTACPSTLFSKFTSQPSFLWDLLQSEEQELKWGNTSIGALSPLQSLVLV